ncbi:hypothetical protein BBJ28_00013348 [Nothophytophthora sp. Chile5]|nr:hypothetical protein BBJ28_00020647 [Nothophytophthora sp. Chile5]RLN93144.1 hypothetical protein BBJ28_00013348 [Nothophytophthora sp. Chile5]
MEALLLRRQGGCARTEHSRGCNDWHSFLEKLHGLLEQSTEEDPISWISDGTQFVIHKEGEQKIETQLGLRSSSLHQVLEELNFVCREKLDSAYTIYHHDGFVRGNPSKIQQIQTPVTPPPSSNEDLAMPNVAYNSALNPLEVRVTFPDPTSHTEYWQVTVAPSILPPCVADPSLYADPLDAILDFHDKVLAESGVTEIHWGEGVDDQMQSDQGAETEMESPLWWSQHSDFSSICSDDLSDMGILSQLSAYYV